MKEKIKKILSEVKNDPSMAEGLSDQTDIINDLMLDSLQLINFVLKVEEAFDVEFDFDAFDYSRLTSIEIFHQFILEQKGAPHGHS